MLCGNQVVRRPELTSLYPLHHIPNDQNLTFKTYSEWAILQKAWEAQLISVLSILKEVDVDQECSASLEEEMFENTDRTRVSGNRQWGLDSGHHQ